MGSLQDVFVRALPGLIGTGVAVLGSKMIDTVVPPKSSNQLFQEYYKAVEGSNLPRTVDEADRVLHGGVVAPAARPMASREPQSPISAYNAPGRSDMAVMSDSITTAIDSLRTAKDHTRCSLCRATLTELEKDVQEKTEFIRQSTRMWEAMQDLKAQGVLPQDAAWSDFTEEQKNKVKAYAG
jgi:hypothetical protein